MNPQQISTFLIATGHIRAMRGGAQLHMLTANDGNAYVVKFANNSQSLRVFANEWLACSIGRAIGLTIPEPAILYVPPKLVETSPSLVIQLSSSTLKCSHGMAFGSRFISEGDVFDYLPESVLLRIDNVEEFCRRVCTGQVAVQLRRSASRVLPPTIKTEIWATICPNYRPYFSFPRHLWRKLRTTNVIERCFVEVRRRTRPMVCFVNVQSVDCIIYSIFHRFNLEWKTRTLKLFTQAA